MFDPIVLHQVKQALKNDGLSDGDIEQTMYYNAWYFRKRVPRGLPPPSLHYQRVRAVFAIYESQLDIKTKKTLFNDTAWAKAKNVLLGVLDGHAADRPGFCFFYQSLDVKGEPAFDEHGIPLLDCNRGTNDTENVHKNLVTTFGTWNTGIEMADALLREFRHRFHHNISERRHRNFPRLGHYDTWLIDHLQLLVERNHNKLLYPSWPNTADYADTEEKFGVVQIHSVALDEALATI